MTADMTELIDDPTLVVEPESPPPLMPPPARRNRRERVVSRVLRRPRNWLDAPWPNQRIARYLTALVVVGGTTFSVLKVVHLDLVFQNNTPTGGDMGAHVMAPAYLRDHLLPHFQLSGWSNYWYAGFPLYRFYMVVPALMILALNVIFPYGVAFKLVAIAGLVTLPACCWAFGRLARFRYPMPELMALAATIFLFDESFSIYGGNVKSTMAGEFSFSIALSFAVLGLGLFARGLETGKHRSWTAILLALAMLCHGIVLLFVVLGAVLLWAVWMDRTRFVYGFTVLAGAALLSAFWVVPFLANHAYMTDMKYHGRPDGASDSYWDMFFPWTTFLDIVVTGFALFGFVAAVVRRHLGGAWLGICSLALVAGVYLAKDSLPIIGLLWNPRLLPFLHLLRLMLMMVGIVEFVEVIVRGTRGHLRRDNVWKVGAATAGVVSVVVLIMEGFLFQQIPGGHMTSEHGKSVYAWGIGGYDPIKLSAKATDAVSDGWTRYNFAGYEGRETYGEYKALIDQMKSLGADTSSHGCGRAMWENNEKNGGYGTTMALMLLPHWTDGCIASMEGLFFEASGTTPYHFVTAAAVSSASSNPVRELRYDNNDAAKAVPYLQTLGVKYLMVFTEKAKAQADTRDELTKVGSVGPWNIYQVAGSDLVEPLAMQPVVVNPRSGDQRERNLEMGMSWFQHRNEWAAMPADGGPASWQRIDVQVDATRSDGLATGDSGRKIDIVQPSEPIVAKQLPAVTVSNVRLGDQDLHFHVDKVGVPVLVKISYFPNWQATGAQGPWRIAPNLMVVVPTSNDVTLAYERSSLDYIAYLLTLLGIAFLVFLRFRGDVRHANTHPFGGSREGADPEWDDWWPEGSTDPTPPEPWPLSWGEPLASDEAIDPLMWASPTEISGEVPAATVPANEAGGAVGEQWAHPATVPHEEADDGSTNGPPGGGSL
jgi:6-pyruvoyl-tetrahydropterin synthase related domain